MIHIREKIQTLVRHRDDTDVGVDGAEGIVCRGCSRVGQRIEQGAFSDVGESDDTELHDLKDPFFAAQG